MKELITIQSELKANKGQYNSFGKYHYRSAEDILEALKPLLAKYKCHLTLTDDIRLIGDRYYVEATATITNGNEEVSVKALARESDSKKGMDSSQVTGATSSYARKYALNGLFCIDDTKDADTDAYTAKTKSDAKDKVQKATATKKASAKQLEILNKKWKPEWNSRLQEKFSVDKLEDLSMAQASELIKSLTK